MRRRQEPYRRGDALLFRFQDAFVTAVISSPVCDCSVAFDRHVHVIVVADTVGVFVRPYFMISSEVDRESLVISAGS